MARLLVQSASLVQSVTAAQQFAVPDLLPWRFINRFLLAKLFYNGSGLAHSQAGKLRSLGGSNNHHEFSESYQY
jgi:hypothetical protein